MLGRTDSDDPIFTAVSRCARIFRANRVALVKALIKGRENRFLEPPGIFEARIADGLNLLIGHLEGRPCFGTLYAGQRATELIRPELTGEENLAACRQSVEQDRAVFRRFLAPSVSAEELLAFDNCYSSATSGITAKTDRHVRTLFVGDCLMAEIASFLLGPLVTEGISIDPFPINSRDPDGLKRILDGLALQQYDVIFFSPFSHSRSPEMEMFSNSTKGVVSISTLESRVTSLIDQTRSILDYLSSRFECPIFVHNGAFLQRSQNALKSAIGSLVAGRATSYARARINRWLADYVGLHNSNAFQHIFVINEDEIASECGRRSASRFLHASAFQHATIFSQKLAAHYQSRIGAIANLMGKKLVICDLDNTLWDGTIGEGSVSHFDDRQKVLKDLREFGGIVLSIVSKNDPENVHFKGGVLSFEDFVSAQISWNSKVDAISKIKKSLNLQTKHMVFVDDRTDERAFVSDAFPDMLVLDACDAETWNRLEIWSQLVRGSSDLDRTKLYKEQALREASVEPTEDADARSSIDALKKLKLVISIEVATKRDLKRVAELINRTNQWNLCGTKTSFEQVKAWHETNNAQVLVGNASDRFGNMGIVCAAIVTMDSQRVEIPAFVLSCRVFGYGVETAMLGEIGRRWINGNKSLVGHYRATNQNRLCASMYADHGFYHSGDEFVWTGTPLIRNPVWAEVRSNF